MLDGPCKLSSKHIRSGVSLAGDLFSHDRRRLCDVRREFLQRLAAGLGDEPHHDRHAEDRARGKERRGVAQTAKCPESSPITTGDSIQQICPITCTHRLYPVARIAVGNNSVESAEVAVRAAWYANIVKTSPARIAPSPSLLNSMYIAAAEIR